MLDAAAALALQRDAAHIWFSRCIISIVSCPIPASSLLLFLSFSFVCREAPLVSSTVQDLLTLAAGRHQTPQTIDLIGLGLRVSICPV